MMTAQSARTFHDVTHHTIYLSTVYGDTQEIIVDTQHGN